MIFLTLKDVRDDEGSSRRKPDWPATDHRQHRASPLSVGLVPHRPTHLFAARPAIFAAAQRRVGECLNFAAGRGMQNLSGLWSFENDGVSSRTGIGARNSLRVSRRPISCPPSLMTAMSLLALAINV